MSERTKHIYYLHANGMLIHKTYEEDLEQKIYESDFVKLAWTVCRGDRKKAWTILVEALGNEAKRSRVYELARRWGCDNEDAKKYAKVMGIYLLSGEEAKAFLEEHGYSPCNYAAHINGASIGEGNSALEAFGNLYMDTALVADREDMKLSDLDKHGYIFPSFEDLIKHMKSNGEEPVPTHPFVRNIPKK